MQSRRCTPPKARLPYAHGSPNSRRRPKPCRRFRQAISYSDLPCKSECICAESGGIRGTLLPHAPAIKRHVCLLLFATFSFKQRKSWPFPFVKGKYLIKSPVRLQKKNLLFALRFSEYEKSYLFHIRIIGKKVNTVAPGKTAQNLDFCPAVMI